MKAQPNPLSQRGVKRAESARQAKRLLRDTTRTHFRLLCQQNGLPMPATEHQFASPRLWRFDYAWPEEKVALEVDGGIFTQGAHVRGARILKTHEKLNAAATLGWRVLYRVPKNLASSETLDLLRIILLPPQP